MAPDRAADTRCRLAMAASVRCVGPSTRLAAATSGRRRSNCFALAFALSSCLYSARATVEEVTAEAFVKEAFAAEADRQEFIKQAFTVEGNGEVRWTSEELGIADVDAGMSDEDLWETERALNEHAEMVALLEEDERVQREAEDERHEQELAREDALNAEDLEDPSSFDSALAEEEAEQELSANFYEDEDDEDMQSRRIMEAFDVDQDGKIKLEEMVAGFGEEVVPSGSGGLDRLKHTFKASDLDADSTLDPIEARHFFKLWEENDVDEEEPEGHHHMMEPPMHSHLAEQSEADALTEDDAHVASSSGGRQSHGRDVNGIRKEEGQGHGTVMHDQIRKEVV